MRFPWLGPRYSPEEYRRAALLGAVAALAPKATTGNVVSLLVAPESLSMRYRRDPLAGVLSKTPASALRVVIGELIREGYLERRAARRRSQSGLGLTEKGRAFVGRLPRRLGRAAVSRSSTLLVELCHWRGLVAKRAGLAERTLLADSVLATIAELRPYTYSDLLQVPAFRKNPKRLALWGESLLDVVARNAHDAGEYLPEDDTGLAFDGRFERGLCLDRYSEPVAGERIPTRIGDALYLWKTHRHAWLAEVLAGKVAALYRSQCADLPPAECVAATSAIERFDCDSVNATLSQLVADQLGINDITPALLARGAEAYLPGSVLLVSDIAHDTATPQRAAGGAYRLGAECVVVIVVAWALPIAKGAGASRSP